MSSQNNPLSPRDQVERYRATMAGDGWHTAPDDGFLYDHLAGLLKDVGLLDDLRGLFATDGWLQARVRQSDYQHYLADLDVAWTVAAAEARAQVDAGVFPESIADCFRYGLIEAALRSWAESHAPTIIARAVEVGMWPADRALSFAALIPNAERRAKLYFELSRLSSVNSEQTSRARAAADAAVDKIENDVVRAHILEAAERPASIDPGSHEGTSKDFGLTDEQELQAALAEKYEEDRSLRLRAIAKTLSPDLLPRALDLALTMEEQFYLDWSFEALAPRLNGALLARALRGKLDDTERGFGIYLIELWAEATKEPTYSESLRFLYERALALRKRSSQLNMWIRIIALLEGDLRREAVAHLQALAWSLNSVEDRAKGLAEAALWLDGEVRERTLLAAREAVSESIGLDVNPNNQLWLAVTLDVLWPLLDTDWRNRLFVAALDIPSDEVRTQLFVVLTDQLTPAQIEQALQMTASFKSAILRIRSLTALSRRLDADRRQTLLQSVCDEAVTIKSSPELLLDIDKAGFKPAFAAAADAINALQSQTYRDHFRMRLINLTADPQTRLKANSLYLLEEFDHERHGTVGDLVFNAAEDLDLSESSETAVTRMVETLLDVLQHWRWDVNDSAG